MDDGSTDGTARVAAEHGAIVESFGENRGLAIGIAAGYAYAAEHGYAYLRTRRRRRPAPGRGGSRGSSRACAPGSATSRSARASSGDGYEPYRYKPKPRSSGRHWTPAASDARRARGGRSTTLRAACTRSTPRRCRSSASRTRPGRPRSRVSCVSETPACAWRRSRSTCGSARAASRSSPARKAALLVLTVIGTLVAYRRVRKHLALEIGPRLRAPATLLYMCLTGRCE